jgi:MoaA/NifB/PqqE/SkfB family radical SAM enzyme
MITQTKNFLSDTYGDFKRGTKQFTTKQTLNLIKAIVRHASYSQTAQLLKLLEMITPANRKKTIRAIQKDFSQKGPWSKMLKKLMSDTNSTTLEGFFDNFVINQCILAEELRQRFEKKEKFSAPWFMAISPSMRCNLRCVGCYAGKYSKKDDLPYNHYDRLICEAKSIGIYFFVILGGEPFFHKDNIKIFTKHKDCFFLVYTNGTLLNEKKIEQIKHLQNVAPAISIEGFEKETTQRRGKNVYKNILKAMDIMKRKKMLFGFSATFTKKNASVIASDKFIDFMIKKGCTFGWIFQYIPIGENPDINLMATPTQREKLRIFSKKVHSTKPIFMADFWNDSPHVGGCMAGGSLYLHINVKGQVEPCVFTHFSTDNIKNKSLIECLKSPFFKMIRCKGQNIRAPHRKSDNMLSPCMIIDNPEILHECITVHKARASYQESKQITSYGKNKAYQFLKNNYSKSWQKIADKAWKKEKNNFQYDCGYCRRCK